VPVDRFSSDLFGEDIHVWLGPNGHVVNYLIRCGQVMNFVAIARADDWRSESWSVEVEVSEVIDRYKDWNPALLELFGKASHCYKWAMFDRDPLQQWSSGRVTLLGDAAHPMLPYLAQGAAMAIEDGYILAALLQRSTVDLTLALKAYQHVRLPRTSRVQLGARARSRENHAASALERLSRNIGYAWQRLVRPAQTMYKVEWIYGYDPQAEFG
jgi:salicylate hydroxylase